MSNENLTWGRSKSEGKYITYISKDVGRLVLNQSFLFFTHLLVNPSRFYVFFRN